jgi:hypothetical protein
MFIEASQEVSFYYMPIGLDGGPLARRCRQLENRLYAGAEDADNPVS